MKQMFKRSHTSSLPSLYRQLSTTALCRIGFRTPVSPQPYETVKQRFAECLIPVSMVVLSGFLGPKPLELDVQPPAQILSPDRYFCSFSRALNVHLALERFKSEKVNKINRKG